MKRPASIPVRNKLNMPLEEYPWSRHALRCIRRAKLVTARDLISKTEAELLRTPGVGGATLSEFKDFAREMGHELGKGTASQSGRPQIVAAGLLPHEASLAEVVRWRHIRLQMPRTAGRHRFANLSDVLRAGITALMMLTGDELLSAFDETPERRRGRLSDEDADLLERLNRPAGWWGRQIDAALAAFDFRAAARAMSRLGSTWEFERARGGTERRAPTAREIEAKAEELLERVASGEKEAAYGGLYVSCLEGELRLMFVAGFYGAGAAARPVKETLATARGRDRGAARKAVAR